MCHNIHNDSFQICVCFASFASAASACDDEAIKHFYTLEGNHNETQQTISVPAADAHSGGKPVRLSGSSHRPDLPEQQGRPGRVRARSDGLGQRAGINAMLPYWGMTTGSLTSYLNSLGYDILSHRRPDLQRVGPRVRALCPADRHDGRLRRGARCSARPRASSSS